MNGTKSGHAIENAGFSDLETNWFTSTSRTMGIDAFYWMLARLRFRKAVAVGLVLYATSVVSAAAFVIQCHTLY